MKKLGPSERAYYNESSAELYHRVNDMWLFSHVLAKQSVHICELYMGKRRGDSLKVEREIESINELNRAWIRIIMHRYSVKEWDTVEKLLDISEKMVCGYTATIAKLIIDGHISDEWLSNVIHIESKFFSTIPGCAHKEMETRKIWMRYTNSILDLIGAKNKYDAARNCIIYGRMLGEWLDVLFT